MPIYRHSIIFFRYIADPYTQDGDFLHFFADMTHIMRPSERVKIFLIASAGVRHIQLISGRAKVSVLGEPSKTVRYNFWNRAASKKCFLSPSCQSAGYGCLTDSPGNQIFQQGFVSSSASSAPNMCLLALNP